MYAFLEGKIDFKSPSLIYLNIGGVGYEVQISLHTYSKIQHMEHCRLYTYHHVREDAVLLFGFAEEQEKQTFKLLLGINGVGATTARIILSSMTTEEISKSVAGADAKAFEKVKGIGAKTAQRIILELKGKISKYDGPNNSVVRHNTKEEDALIALVNLGIARSMAEGAIKKLNDPSTLSVEDIIKQALKNL